MFLKNLKKAIQVAALFAIVLPFRTTLAQEVVVANTTISGQESFSASSAIVIGPQVAVSATGIAIFAAKRMAVIPQFVIANGGKAYFLSSELTTSVASGSADVPREFKVYQNYPNPFNPSTQISYELPVAAQVDVVIFNSLGQKIKTVLSARQGRGSHVVQWNGTNSAGSRVGSGVYYYSVLMNGANAATKKMILTK